jgi:glutaredoxin
MDKLLVLFTMKGCPWCDLMKHKLKEQHIDFIDRDIDKYDEEYKLFTDVTNNDFIPAFMVIENVEPDPVSYLYAPERDFDEIDDGIKIIKEHFNK